MMAAPIISFFTFLLSSSLVLVLISLSLEKSYALERREAAAEDYYHTIHISSLIPSSSPPCKVSSQGPSKKSSLKVVHRHGPCQQYSKKKPTLSEVLSQDQSRVNSIHTHHTFNPTGKNKFRGSKTTLPAKSGVSLGTANYVVSVGLGTPIKTLTLAFDTGSGLTWTQCQPCVRFCYKQQDPIFDPISSTSYSNITCNSPQCTALSSTTGNNPGCSTSTCLYAIQYGDQSFSIGFFAKEKLTLTPSDVFDNFLLGCGQQNRGLFGGTAGLIGLGKDSLSIVSQTAQKYGKFFSYCLPTRSGSNGHLTFGKTGIPGNVKYTPLTNTQKGHFYFVDILAITVGGQQLSISQSIFQTAGTIVDSGTVITRLPATAYAALKTAFSQQMKNYPKAPAFSLLDTCYDFSNFTTVQIPKIVFTFGGNLKVDLPLQDILLGTSKSSVCLAFAGNSDDSDVGIYGNIQQQTFEVVYDVAGGKLGFGPASCS